MNTLERVMRVMTHVNIGATLVMVASLVWSGHQLVAGDWKMPRVKPVTTHTPRSDTTTPEPPSCCLAPPSTSRPPLQVDASSVLRGQRTGSVA